MYAALGLLVLACVGGDDSGPSPPTVCRVASAPLAEPAPAEDAITYDVLFVEIGGLKWRSALHHKLQPVARQGTATIWTADKQALADLSTYHQGDTQCKVVRVPKITATPGGEAEIVHQETPQHYVADVKRIADGPHGHATRLAYQPEVGQIHDGLRLRMVGRKLDQGILTCLTLNDTEFLAFHTVAVGDGVGGTPVDPKATVINAQYQVPEVAQCDVKGEWLIPNEEALVVSLGVHEVPKAEAPACPVARLVKLADRALTGQLGLGVTTELRVRERLVLVSAHVAEPSPSAAPEPARPAPSSEPDASCSVTSITEPAAPPPPPEPATPPLPSRTLPLGVKPDGTTHDPLPPLPDEEVAPASGQESSEPRPSPQAPHPTPSRQGTDAPRAPDNAKADPACAQPALKSTTSSPTSCSKPASASPICCPASACSDVKAGEAEGQEVRELTLPDAIRIAMDNCEGVRLVGWGVGMHEGVYRDYPDPKSCLEAIGGTEANQAPIIIARINADASLWRFKAEAMALVRSVEQQYWSLVHQRTQLWARERAVELAEEALQRPQEQAGRSFDYRASADIAEARQQLEGLRCQLAAATAEVKSTERELRKTLGLPETDNRRIVPATTPHSALVQPDWDACLEEMLTHHPDIVQAETLARLQELQLIVTRNQLIPQWNLMALYQLNGLSHHLDAYEAELASAILNTIDSMISNTGGLALQNLPGDPIGLMYWTPRMARAFSSRDFMRNTRQAQYMLLRQRASLQQIKHQTTHALARCFLEIETNYKQFQASEKLRREAEDRLQTQKKEYEAGRIPLDRYFQAIGEWANAQALESQFLTSYNVSIAHLEEAKGTLLDHEGIIVATAPLRKAKPAPESSPDQPKTAHAKDRPDAPAPTSDRDEQVERASTAPTTGPLEVVPPPAARGPRPVPEGLSAPVAEPTELSRYRWVLPLGLGRIEIRATVKTTPSAPRILSEQEP
jgi:outer membrane protein TolC